MNRSHRPRRSRLIATVLTLIAAVVLIGQVPQSLAKKSVFEQLDLLVDVRHEIVSEYVEEPDQDELVHAAVRAMVESLNDPYTQFLAPEDLNEFKKHVGGSFSGIGAEVDMHNGRLRIVSPLEDSPAWKAGILPGDIVLEIDGVSTEGMKITECINRLTGEEGTDVTIRVRHETGEEAELTITRGRIVVETVRSLRRDANLHWNFMLDQPNRIGYIRLTQFTDQTDEAIQRVLDELLEADLKGLIIDVRFNPGGLLESAVAVSDLFLTDGQQIVSIKGRSVPEKVHAATSAHDIPDIPIVMIANEASASAAEILTGALLDNDRAQFVGARTFGKGSVQQVRMLEGGQGALKITNAYYYLPSGRNIHRKTGADVWGVDPADGFYVPMDADAVREMIRTRREHPALRANANGDDTAPLDAVTPEWIETELKDPQLAAALRAVRGRIDTGDWPRVGEDGSASLALEARRDALRRQREAITKRLEEIDAELAGQAPAQPDDADPEAGAIENGDVLEELEEQFEEIAP